MAVKRLLLVPKGSKTGRCKSYVQTTNPNVLAALKKTHEVVEVSSIPEALRNPLGGVSRDEVPEVFVDVSSQGRGKKDKPRIRVEKRKIEVMEIDLGDGASKVLRAVPHNLGIVVNDNGKREKK